MTGVERVAAGWVAPMLATLVKDAPPENEGWIYQRKFDGLRAIAVRRDRTVELWSRNHLSFLVRFPGLASDLLEMPGGDFVIDGEIVAFRGEVTGFENLQLAGSSVVYEVFDLLHLGGERITGLVQTERDRLLHRFAQDGWPPAIRPVEPLVGEGSDLIEMACRQGWEGVVAKNPTAPYLSGRSRDWRKLKCDASQELVIGGWTDPGGSRSHFGAVLVGVYDEAGLRYAGKVGSGFGRASLESMSRQFAALARAESPFLDAPRFRDVHWVEPVLVAAISFTEWTADGRLRHPRFTGLRPDKAARDVRRES